MSPQISCRMPIMHDRMVSNWTSECMFCLNMYIYANQSNNIESCFGHWFALPDCRSTNWFNRHRPRQVNSVAVSSNRGFRCADSVPPTRSTVNDKPPGYRLLLNTSTDSPDSNYKTLNNLNKRNRSLVPKSRERSHRQGGRWGDKT